MIQVLPPFRAVILDMDGLALDSESTYAAAWHGAAVEMGQFFPADFCHGLFGQHADDVERAMLEAWQGEFDRVRFMECATRHWHTHLETHGIRRMPGLDELLDLLKQKAIPHALATNSDAPYAAQCLAWAGATEFFGHIVTRDQVAQGKPAPDVFIEAARRLGVSPAECLVLEDSAVGLLAARAAGAIAVLVQRDDARRERLCRDACLSFSTLTELVGLIS